MRARSCLTGAPEALYYFFRMNDKPPGKPPAVPGHLPTKMEAWYLAALVKWAKIKKRPPWVHELAGWLGKSNTAVYSALVSLEHKGYVRRVGKGDTRADRRFEAVPA